MFTLKGDPLPCTSLTEHEIIFKSGKIINLRSHKLPEKHREFSLQETDKLLRKNIIRESQSPYNSPLWIIPKKGNKLRIVIDYRKINEDTDQDAYPLPVIDDILIKLEKQNSSQHLTYQSDFIKHRRKKATKNTQHFLHLKDILNIIEFLLD